MYLSEVYRSCAIISVLGSNSFRSPIWFEGGDFREIASGAEMLPQRRLGEHAHHQECQADAGWLKEWMPGEEIKFEKKFKKWNKIYECHMYFT